MSVIFSFVSVIFWFVVLLVPLVLIHELGHYLMAKLVGIKILEFGVGLPFSKRLLYKEWKGSVWSIYPWLLGGFVRVYGDNDALDQVYETQKTNTQETKKIYLENRLVEILQNRDLEFFLKENHLDFDSEWQWFTRIFSLKEEARQANLVLWTDNFSNYKQTQAKLASLPTAEQEARKKEAKAKFKQKLEALQTLIEWELDAKLQDKRKLEQAFFAKSWWQKVLVILGGVTFNFLSAILLFWFIFGVFGGGIIEVYMANRGPIFYREIQELQNHPHQKVSLESPYPFVLHVVQDSLAQKAGLQVKDQLVSVGNSDPKQMQNLQSHEELAKIIQEQIALARQTDRQLKITLISSEEKKQKEVTVSIPDTPQELKLGISAGYAIRRQAKNPLNLALSETWRVSTLTLRSLGEILNALKPQATDRSAIQNVSGPIGVGYVGSLVVKEEGIRGVLYLMAIISVSLAIFNLLPIPVLDGGRLIIVTLNRITGKRNKKLETVAFGFTMILMLGLAVLIAFKDVFTILSRS